jgi:hypothetical protein
VRELSWLQKQLEQAVQVDPHHPVQYRNLALAYGLSACFGDAERFGRIAVDLDRTGDGTARFVLGRTCPS